MKRQVVLLMTDTTRKDMLGCYGNPDMKTPCLDKMAQEGLRYDNAYTCQPVCGPARSAIFTGMSPHANGMIANSLPLGANVRTIGQRMAEKGVRCAYIGKWHLDGGDYFGMGICPPGYDPEYWFDMRCYLNGMDEEGRRRSRDPKTADLPEFPASFTYAHQCSDRAVRYLEEYGKDDFFLTVSYDEPHGPSLCPAPYRHMYDGYHFPDSPVYTDSLNEKPMYQKLWAGENLHAPNAKLNQPSNGLSQFLGCNSFADAEIGRVLDAVRMYAPDALVIYTSDHGDMLGAHRLFSKNAAVYREVANIPLIVWGKAYKNAAGRTCSAPASHIDLAPSIMDYFGLPIPKAMEGKSMLRQFKDPQTSVNDAVYTEFTRYEVDHDGFGGLQMMRAIITKQYKLAIHLLDTDEFYDLAEDPYELHNCINDPEKASVRNALHDQLLAHMNQTRDPYRGYQWRLRPWREGFMQNWENDGYTRQREEEDEPRQLDYDTGLPMECAVRHKT